MNKCAFIRLEEPTAILLFSPLDHFTVGSSVTWPLNGSEVGGDLVLIQTTAFVVYEIK